MMKSLSAAGMTSSRDSLWVFSLVMFTMEFIRPTVKFHKACTIRVRARVTFVLRTSTATDKSTLQTARLSEVLMRIILVGLPIASELKTLTFHCLPLSRLEMTLPVPGDRAWIIWEERIITTFWNRMKTVGQGRAPLIGHPKRPRAAGTEEIALTT